MSDYSYYIALKAAAEGWAARAMAAETELAEKWEEVKALAEQVAETKRRADASLSELRAENSSLYVQLKEAQGL